MNLLIRSTLLVATVIVGVSACAPLPREQRADRYGYEQRSPSAPVPAARDSSYAEFGQVRDIQVIPVAARTSGGGAIIGAVLGAVIGNQFGSGGGRALATGAGAVGGAVVGNSVEKRRNRSDDEVYRVTVRFRDGATRDFDFQRIDDLRVGDSVKWENGQLHRL